MSAFTVPWEYRNNPYYYNNFVPLRKDRKVSKDLQRFVRRWMEHKDKGHEAVGRAGALFYSRAR